MTSSALNDSFDSEQQLKDMDCMVFSRTTKHSLVP